MASSEELTKYLKEFLGCPVCLQTIQSVPIFQCLNGHVACINCHSNLQTCPICRDTHLYDGPIAIRNLKLEEIVKR